MGEYKCFLVTFWEKGSPCLDCSVKLHSRLVPTCWYPADWISQYVPDHVKSGREIVKIREIFEVYVVKE